MATKKGKSKGASKKPSAKKSASKKSASKKQASKKSATKKVSAKAAVVAGKCGGWLAVENVQPPAPFTLRVTGKCVFPKHGYKVTLKEAVPQGINPAILLLRKTVTPPTGPVIQTPQVVPVRFTKKTNRRYTAVTILPDGTTVKVKIIA